MQMINDFIDEIKNRLWETHLRIEKLKQVVPENVGCLVFKGKYMYWQFYENGHQIQRYVPIKNQEEVRKKFEIINHQKQTLQELKQLYDHLKIILQIYGFSSQDILSEFASQKPGSEVRTIDRKTAMENATKKKFADQYRYMSDKGDQVASKSELIIANTLYANDVQYSYEEPLKINGYIFKPDFTIWRPDGSKVLWEHAGLLDKADYAKSFDWKLTQYEMAGFDRSDTLIITKEKNFSAYTIRRLIVSYELK